MPELPEVEICMRELSRRLRGKTIQAIEVRDDKIKLSQSLVGQKILKISRRGKLIIFRLADDRRILVHLGMTGWFEFAAPPEFRMAIITEGDSAYFEDARRFGKVHTVSAAQQQTILAKLGTEPLAPGFDLSGLTKTKRAIKIALLDQRLIAGLGNIYASESLWRAGIDPRRRADQLREDERRRLRGSIIAVLRKAIAFGARIYEAQRFAVYDREDEPCRRCHTSIRRILMGGRGTYFCPGCQQ
jgi:formamidopyrimidine-DNA glycosylase